MTAPAFEMVDSAQVRPLTPRVPRSKKPAGPQYVARKPMQIGGRKIKIGDLVPEAGSWPRVESWIRSGYLDVKE
jgi:hypothetical protein